MAERSKAMSKSLPSRKLVCLAGLPIDVVTLSEAMQAVRDAVARQERLFLSTPNLNFMIAAQHDAAFRESILLSDLSVADGSSLVMLAKLMGSKLPERVTGSDLFEQLARSDGHPPIKVFLFGGPPGAGAMAAARLNKEFPGVNCVGHDEAGFGDVASMSGQPLIDRINASGADFVLVALGAKKGQAWILHNQHRLNAPVISHLGAVINFMAGTVRRSPRWLQQIGMEWIWRIVQEPVLWRRYWDDGLAFLSLLARNVAGGALLDKLVPHPDPNSYPGKAELIRDHSGHTTIRLAGCWHDGNADQLWPLLNDESELLVNMKDVKDINPNAMGTLIAMHGLMRRKGGSGLVISHATGRVTRQIRSMGADYLLREPTASRFINQEA
jgi:N-acetylglucosaminyldiphosphoundecaprenol N-acetyl-beta-D-mannosaminyltransferase